VDERNAEVLLPAQAGKRSGVALSNYAGQVGAESHSGRKKLQLKLKSALKSIKRVHPL
jgi:hypothetical protein